MKPNRTWILVANRGEARICANEGRSEGVHELPGMKFDNDILPDREVMADRQGRAFDSVGAGRHAMERPSDPAEQADHQFAHRLIEKLHDGLARQQCDRLVIAAAPAMLAKLRKAMTPDVSAKVQAEIDKDYTSKSMKDLADLLRRAQAID